MPTWRTTHPSNFQEIMRPTRFFKVVAVICGLSVQVQAANPVPPPPVVPPAVPPAAPSGPTVVTLDERNTIPGLPVMTFFVRYPKGMTSKDKVNGVFANVTHLTQKATLEKWIKRPSSSDLNFQFADKYKLAVVTWTTATMYSISDSFVVDADEERNPDNSMEQCFRTWKIGMDRLCRTYGLPENGYLIYGYSRGAQWAHRIALRSPEKFVAVHIHINSSYAEPSPEAAHCLWLLTTGELEHGNKAARLFFQKGLALNYPILLRIYPGKAHENFPEEEILGVKFFEYALKLKSQQLEADLAKMSSIRSAVPESALPMILDESLFGDFRHPPYVGDMLNGDVYPKAKEELLPESQRVGIPTTEIAKSWGYFHP